MKNRFSWRFCKGMIPIFLFLQSCLMTGPNGLLPTWAIENDLIYRENIIEDPGLSSWCEEVLQVRKEKIKLKQKAQALIRRNLKLQQLTPEHKFNLRKKLKFLHNRLSQELTLLTNQIQNIEEDIIRRGCPGVIL